MDSMDRRRLVQSLSATIAFAALTPSLACSEVTEPNERLRLKEWWTMIRHRDPLGISNAEGYAVDFWSREYSEFDYGHYLPPEIQQTSLFYESCDRQDFNNETALSYIDTIPERFGLRSSMLGETLNWHVCWDANYLSGSYLSIASSPSSSKKLRTALIAIDSKGRSPNEPEWAEMLPDFRRTYERIVGLYYAGNWDRNKSSRAGSYCDAVIITSPELAETDDLGLATEAFVGEPIRRFSRALLDRKFLDRMLNETPRFYNSTAAGPRFFALGRDVQRVAEFDLFAL